MFMYIIIGNLLQNSELLEAKIVHLQLDRGVKFQS